jgi:hypothetical protein
MKRRSSLDISVAESEAKLDASACHSLVGGVATYWFLHPSLMLIQRTLVKLWGSKVFVFNQSHNDLHTQSFHQFLYSSYSSKHTKREYHDDTLQCYPFAKVIIMAALYARGEGCTTTNGPFSSYYQKSNPIQHQSNSFLTDWNPKPAVLTHPQLEYYLPQSNKTFQKQVSIGIIPIQYQKPL